MANFFKVGSLGTDSPASVKSMTSRTTSANNYMTLESVVGTDYQVPAGKTFYITSVVYMANSASGGIKIGYGDTGVADGAAAPTNFVQLTEEFRSETADKLIPVSVLVAIPAGKFPCVRQNAGAVQLYVTYFGVEV